MAQAVRVRGSPQAPVVFLTQFTFNVFFCAIIITMKSKHVTFIRTPLLMQQREICVQMNRHFDEDVCRASSRGSAGQ